jgi:uncharacterized protein (TIGR03435 family)
LGARAQTPIAFEVASIKPSAPVSAEATTSSGFTISGGRVIGFRVTALTLVAYAYSLRTDQVSGLPDWTKTDRWDIEAKTPGDTEFSSEQVRLMFRGLLADRFGLKLTHDLRETSVYRLDVVEGGSKLRPVTNPDLPFSRRVARTDRVEEWTEGKQTIQALLIMLEANLRMPVVNMTGLTGTFVYSLRYVPERFLTSTNAPAGPSIGKALEEQLGLRLVRARLPLEYVAIERIEKPTGN